jgi:Na+/H+ antiporter NhaA
MWVPLNSAVSARPPVSASSRLAQREAALSVAPFRSLVILALGLGMLGGVGFTMALCIATLA